VSIAIPNKFSVEMIQEIYDGIKLACKNYSVDLVGGDTTATAGPLVISVNILGESLGSKLSLRSGAQNNDIVIVTGSLGAAYLGLQILEREKLIFKDSAEVQPDLKNYKYILERQLKPEARIDVIKNLKNLKVIPTSMIDISDGLSSELNHISKSSNLGIKIFIDKIPFAKETRKTAEELNIDLLVSALFGGEDYELLFTVSLADFEKIKNNPIYSPVGHISKDVNGVKLYDSSGKSVEINHNSWTAFQK
jgi:thiamine-monophosphate kinase